jgi:hypothetical protein
VAKPARTRSGFAGGRRPAAKGLGGMGESRPAVRVVRGPNLGVNLNGMDSR